MTGLSWSRKKASRDKFDNRRHSADVGALLRNAIQEPVPESTGSFSTDLPRAPTSEKQRPPTPEQRPQTSNPLARKNTESNRNKRFSILRFRTASDPALGAKARAQAVDVPPMPDSNATPSIITTAPTFDDTPLDVTKNERKKPDIGRSLTISNPGSSANFNSTSSLASSNSNSPRPSISVKKYSNSRAGSSPSVRASRVTFDEPGKSQPPLPSIPPPYDDTHGTLPLPQPRFSESSRSTVSDADVAYTTTTTTHTVSTTTTFFRFRKKKDTPLFPLPPKTYDTRISTDADTALSSDCKDSSIRSRPSFNALSVSSAPRRSATESPQPHSSMFGSSKASTNPLLRTNSATSAGSGRSNSVSTPNPRYRPRSSTMSSIDRAGTTESGRSSLAGRNSLGGFFGLRRQTESTSRTSSPHPYNGRSSTSGANSLAVSQERLIIPERHDEDTPDRYLQRLEEAVSKSVVASLLSKTDDAFHVAVLKRYLASFNFVRDPMDMALRKLLMEVELPKETQQIDRVLQAFADRYHDCNPLIYASSTQAYFIAFSLLILHTDVFNKNNKYKMQKADYVKNTSGEGVTPDVLEYFYDNISYTPFIHVEDDLDINGDKIVIQRPKRTVFGKSTSDVKRSKEPVDPYTLIIENKLQKLRPNLDDVLIIEDPYKYLGTAQSLDMASLHYSFFRSAVLQIVSARSRPDAFLDPAKNPQDASPGVVEIKVTKIGILWRKGTKKKKTRSPWQEWGALLTGSQLYFFRNVSWIKTLLSQYEQHIKAGNSGIPCIFSPPMLSFNPDSFMSTDDAVALLDSTYKKHKNAFMFVKHGGQQEYLLADSEAEMNDWLAKLNYAAAFRTAQVRMRGVVGGLYDGQRTRGIRRLDSSNSGFRSVQTPSGEVSILSGRIDPQLAAEISAARRQVIDRKITEYEEKLANSYDTLAGFIRNAHHLKTLTPLQLRTREAIMEAATSLAAKIVWIRMEIWKFKCHRDVLLLDLDEERRTAKDKLRRHLSVTTPPETPPRSIKSPILSPSSPNSASTGSTPTQATVSAALNKKRDELTRAASTVSNVSRSTTTTSTHGAWEVPSMPFDIKRSQSYQTTASERATSPTAGSPLFGSEMIELTSIIDGNTIERSYTPTPAPRMGDRVDGTSEEDDDSKTETASQSDHSSITKTRVGGRVDELATPVKVLSQDKPTGEKEKERESNKLRKSLHRTLRESTQQLAHQRSRKSRDVSDHHHPLAEGDEADATEKLPRSSQSFSIHGKKASVITFGSEWQSMDPETRLARHRSGATTSSARMGDESIGTALSTATGVEANSLGRVLVAIEQEQNAAQAFPVTPSSPMLDTIVDDNKSDTASTSTAKLIVVNPDAPSSSSSPTRGRSTTPVDNTAPEDRQNADFIPDADTDDGDEKFVDAEAVFAGAERDDLLVYLAAHDGTNSNAIMVEEEEEGKGKGKEKERTPSLRDQIIEALVKPEPATETGKTPSLSTII